MQKILTIGITETEAAYENYPVWIKGNDPEIEIIKLTTGNIDDLLKCSGIVLSGGIDIHPRFYNNSRINYPNAPKSFNEVRDEFELEVFQTAQERDLPVLAICRGMQLVNVFMGGTIIQDLEENKKSNHRKHNDRDGIHDIKIERYSLLFSICKNETGMINSAHHQGLEAIASELRVSAWSHDEIAEVIERKNWNSHPFFLGVQGHPERFAHFQPNNIFIHNIRLQFIEAVRTYTICKS